MPDVPISNFVTSLQVKSLGTISVLINLSLRRMAQTAAVFIEAASVFFQLSLIFTVYSLPFQVGLFCFNLFFPSIFFTACDSTSLGCEVT